MKRRSLLTHSASLAGLAALATLPVSLNTSWRFFDEVLNIPTAGGERYIMFAVAELALIVSGAGMAVNVRRTGHPGRCGRADPCHPPHPRC